MPAVLSFLGHVVRHFPLARWALALTLLLLVLEYAGISVMIPLAASSGGASGSGASHAVSRLWGQAVAMLGLTPTLMTWVWLFLVLLALRSAAGYVHVLVTTYLSKQVHRRLSEDVFRRVLVDEPMTQVYKRSIGYYVSLAGDDTFRAGSLVNSGLQMLAGVLSAGAGLVLLYLFSPLAFAATLGFLVLSALLVLLCIRQMLRRNGQSVALSREAGTGFLEALNSLRSIRSMGCEPFVRETYRGQMQRYTRLLFEVDGLKAGIKAVPGLVALLTGVVALGPWFSGALPLAPQAVFAGTTIIIRIFISLGALMTSAGAFLVDARAAKDLGELIQADDAASRADAGPAAAAAAAALPPPAGGFGALALRHVHYAYAPGLPVLQDLSFTFREGRVHAIIGPSGSGKSTLADLLLGMFAPDAGEILLDGLPIPPEALRRRVVLVEQQPRIFSVSVRDNLSLGLAVSDADIEAVLEAVDLGDVIRALPAGIHTLMDYQGSNLSGGQRQRLSIARALLRQPQVLILDEATSALDPQTRDLVVARIRARLQHGVIVFITHDETIAELADVVLALSPCQAGGAA
jgi:ATP-binding cassette subfamily B protein